MKLRPSFGAMSLLAAASVLVAWIALQAAVPAADGATVFKANCVMCHGADGKGYPALGTPDFTSSKWQSSMKDAQIREVIANGKKGTQMPAFGKKLNGQDVSAVIGYIRSLKKK